MADNILRMVLGVLVGAWVARYLGPEQFGELAYAIAFVALFQAVSKLGLDSIAIRDIARNVDAAPAILGTALRLRLVTGLICWATAIGGMALLRPGDTTALLLVAIVAGTLVFQAADTVDLWFQSCTQSKRTVISKTGVVLLTSLVRVALIVTKAPLVAFAVVMLIEALLAALALAWAYRRYPVSAVWTWRTKQAQQLLQESWPFLLSGIAIIIYMRIDQLMLREMVGEYELGIYSAALPLSTAWYFIPMAICTSMAPTISRIKSQSEENYLSALKKIFSLMWWMSIVIVFIMTFLSHSVVTLIYGSHYSASAKVLSIHIFATIPVFLGAVNAIWVANEKRGDLALKRTLFGASLNVFLNFLLIPLYGAEGAAVSTVVSQFFASILLNMYYSFKLFVIQIKSLYEIRVISMPTFEVTKPCE